MEFSIKRSYGWIIASIAADVRTGARGAGSTRARDGHRHPRLDLPQGWGTDADRPRRSVRGHPFGRLSREATWRRPLATRWRGRGRRPDEREGRAAESARDEGGDGWMALRRCTNGRARSGSPCRDGTPPAADLPQGWAMLIGPRRYEALGRLLEGDLGRCSIRALQKWSGMTIAGTTTCCGDWAPVVRAAWTSGSSGSIPRRTGNPSPPCRSVSNSVNAPCTRSCSILSPRPRPSARRSGLLAVRLRLPDCLES